jgi:hypothetical protein
MKNKLTEWVIFAILILVITHMTYGLDELGTFGWTMIGVISVVIVVVETVFDVGFDWLFVKLGLKSGGGPLTVTATEEGDKLVLTLRNDGNNGMNIAVIEGLDENGKSVFATMPSASSRARVNGEKVNLVREAGKRRLKKGESARIVLDGPLLEDSGYQTLQVMDSNAESWPVQWARGRQGSSAAG